MVRRYLTTALRLDDTEEEASVFFTKLIFASLENWRDRVMNDFAHAARH